MPIERAKDEYTGKDILAIPVQENDADAKTIGGYLQALLYELWKEGEGFSGKRPFGNSSWEYDLYKPLVVAGIVDGELDEDGYIDKVDRKAANTLIFSAINAMCSCK